MTTFWIIFSHIFTPHAQKQLFLSFRLQLMTTPSDSATTISYDSGYFGNRSTYSVLIWHFLSTNPPYFYFRSTWPNFLKIGTRITVSKWLPFTNFEADPTRPSVTYDTFISNTLSYIVTLTIDILTLNDCRKFFVTRSSRPPTLSILRPSVLELRCSHSDCYWQYKIAYCQLRMRNVTWPICKELILTTFLKTVTPICHFATFMAD